MHEGPLETCDSRLANLFKIIATPDVACQAVTPNGDAISFKSCMPFLYWLSYILSIPGLKESILEMKNLPIEEYVDHIDLD